MPVKKYVKEGIYRAEAQKVMPANKKVALGEGEGRKQTSASLKQRACDDRTCHLPVSLQAT
jgi:hypothetical protein